MKTYFEEKTKNAMSQTQNPMNFPLQLVHCFFIAFSLLFNASVELHQLIFLSEY